MSFCTLYASPSFFIAIASGRYATSGVESLPIVTETFDPPADCEPPQAVTNARIAQTAATRIVRYRRGRMEIPTNLRCRTVFTAPLGRSQSSSTGTSHRRLLYPYAYRRVHCGSVTPRVSRVDAIAIPQWAG